MKKRKKLFVILLLSLAVLGSGANFYARYEAWKFGKGLSGALTVLGTAGVGDTEGCRAFFEGPEMAGCIERVHRLSFLGGNCEARMLELQTGILYCTEQMAVPPARRFATPPAFRHLSLETGDHSDDGVAHAMLQLTLTNLGR